MVPCSRCGAGTDPDFAEQSGDLCGICLADFAVPLTRIPQGVNAGHWKVQPVPPPAPIPDDLFVRCLQCGFWTEDAEQFPGHACGTSARNNLH